MTGTGGGIFLTPLLVLAGWTGTRDAAGLSGSFILVNSIAGLAGLLSVGLALPQALPLWIGAVAAGGLIGSWLGAARYSVLSLQAGACVRAPAGGREARILPVTAGVGWRR